MADTDLNSLKIDKSGWQAGGTEPQASPRGPLRRLSERLPKRPWQRWTLAAAAVIALMVLYRQVLPAAIEVEMSSVSLVHPSLAVTDINSSGYVTAQRKASVASKTTARLVWLGVEEGSVVRTGEVIAKLESDDVLASHDKAESSHKASQALVEHSRSELADASANYRRMKRLLEEQIISQSDFDAAEARYKKARASVDNSSWSAGASRAAMRESRAALEYTLLRAPFDAVVLTKNADIGDIVTPLGASASAKASVATVADMASLLVETDVSESSVGKVKKGQPCEITLDALPDERFPGFVHMIVPTADRTKASVLVKVKFRSLDPRVLPEMSAKVAFLSRDLADDERRARPAAPKAAVAKRGGKNLVFAVDNGVATAVEVTTGAEMGDFVELEVGPEPGTRVVLNPPAELDNGSTVAERQ